MAAELALLEGTLGLRNGTKYGAQGERQVKGAGGGPRAAPARPRPFPGRLGLLPARFVPRRRRAALPAPSCAPSARPSAGWRLGTGSACRQLRAGVVKSWAGGQLLTLEMQPRQRAVAVKCILR